ncbi:transcription termination/antitermination protein NusG [Brucella anthropi]|uniref:transcription termination/antitermination protein NusG n=1 Tax=Brucella anthropi TaxID=529 RepID=UPI00124E6510|nr:transcription termination/antitermination NusG family protein [Brucella anthropi]KAB2748034.1 antitermination protein NusG [Brucella anthropi]
MMMADKRLIDQAAHIDLTRCYAKLDRFMEERKRRRAAIEKAAIRAGDDSPWLVLRVMTGRETLVRDMLASVNVEVLSPTKMGPKLRRQGREIAPKAQPVMIGYVLARVVMTNENIATLLGFDHVISVLGGYEKPYLVNAERVLIFNQKAEKGEFDHEVPQSAFIGVKRVLIREGIFAGFVAELITGGAKGKGVAVVEITFGNQPTPMTVPLAFLTPL